MSIRYIIPLLRLRFVPMTLMLFFFGVVMATGQLNPRAWPELWGRCGLAALALVCWACTIYLLNDAVDVADDRTNPRRQNSPLVKGLIQPREVFLWGLLLQAAALILAFFVSRDFFLNLCVLGILGGIYSIPPLRCKGRPGWDVLIQAVPFAFLIPLSGWSVVRSLAGSPWWLYVHLLLGWMALMLLVLLYDLPTDRARGIRTTAVALGVRGTLRAFVVLMGISLFMLPVFAATKYLITSRFLDMAFPLAMILMLFLPAAWRRRTDPAALKRYIYRCAYLGLLPYILWFLVLGGVLPG